MNKFNIGYEKFYLGFIERTLVKLNIDIKDINIYYIDYIIDTLKLKTITEKTLTSIRIVFEQEGFLVGKNTEERLKHYVKYIESESFIEYIGEIYPETVGKMSKTIKILIDNYYEIDNRLNEDKYILKKEFGFYLDRLIDAKMYFNNSDMHKGMKSIFIIEYENIKIVYKPRNGCIDLLWNASIDWLNDINKKKYSNKPGLANKLYISKAKCISKDGYHWCEYVCGNTKNANDKDEIGTIYKKMGMLLGLSYILNITDIHMENIIINGTDPYIIDVESAFQVSEELILNKSEETALDIVKKYICNSIINTGMLGAY